MIINQRINQNFTKSFEISVQNLIAIGINENAKEYSFIWNDHLDFLFE